MKTERTTKKWVKQTKVKEQEMEFYIYVNEESSPIGFTSRSDGCLRN